MNSVCIIGNLTRDPELRHTQSGAAVCELGVAVNERKKVGDEWEDVAHFFDVTVWNQQAENCAQYLSKGKRVGVTGRLQQDRWTTDSGENRSKVKIVAQRVEFLTPRGDGESSPQWTPAATSTAGGDFGPATADDDIPF